MKHGADWGMEAIEALEARGLCVTDDLLDLLELEGFDAGKVGAMRKASDELIRKDLGLVCH